MAATIAARLGPPCTTRLDLQVAPPVYPRASRGSSLDVQARDSHRRPTLNSFDATRACGTCTPFRRRAPSAMRASSNRPTVLLDAVGVPGYDAAEERQERRPLSVRCLPLLREVGSRLSQPIPRYGSQEGKVDRAPLPSYGRSHRPSSLPGPQNTMPLQAWNARGTLSPPPVRTLPFSSHSHRLLPVWPP